MVSISSRRILHLNEFLRNLEFFGIKEMLIENKILLRSLSINSFETVVNANYVFSLVEPTLSDKGSFRKSVEEKMFDNLQDFLIMTEDERISGATEFLAYYADDEISAKELEAKINPAGFLKWVAGLSHNPLNIGNSKITNFVTKKPLHELCFLVIRA